jgi:hypothetical protein
MYIPDPEFFPTGSRIQQQKRGGGKNKLSYLSFSKLVLNKNRKNLSHLTKNLRMVNPKKFVLSILINTIRLRRNLGEMRGGRESEKNYVEEKFCELLNGSFSLIQIYTDDVRIEHS